MSKLNILVVDDDKEITEAIEIYLINEGYNVLVAYDGVQALKIAREEDIHLIIMDLMMPNLDGTRATIELRKEKEIPIIMLSAKSEDSDKILGLNLGADDYLTKPFNPLELVARVNAQIRRVYKLSAKQNASPKIVIGDIELDTYNVKLIVRGKEVEVTSIEYGILKYLMENAGRILTKNQIFEAVWNEAFLSGDNTIMVHISRLRDKIEEDSRNPVYLKTVRGLGYKFEKR